MNCKEAVDAMPAFADDELTAAQETEFRAHLAGCTTCRDMAKVVKAFAESLTAQIKGHGRKIKPPSGAKDELLLRLGAAAGAPTPMRRVWIAVAAMFLGAFCVYGWYTISSRPSAEETREYEALKSQYFFLTSLKKGQEELEAVALQCKDDPPAVLVACAYLPSERSTKVLRSAFGEVPNEERLNSLWPEESERIVELRRQIHQDGRDSEVLFEQWSDGRVHVYHAWREGENHGETDLYVRDYLSLIVENVELCRELEIVDRQGCLLAAVLPIPCAPTLRHDVVRAVTTGAAPGSNPAERFAFLRIAKTVTQPEEFFERYRALTRPVDGRPVACIQVPSTPPPASPTIELSLDELRQAVRRLHNETGGQSTNVHADIAHLLKGLRSL